MLKLYYYRIKGFLWARKAIEADAFFYRPNDELIPKQEILKLLSAFATDYIYGDKVPTIDSLSSIPRFVSPSHYYVFCWNHKEEYDMLYIFTKVNCLVAKTCIAFAIKGGEVVKARHKKGQCPFINYPSKTLLKK